MNGDESLLDAYICETQQLLESLENTLFSGEQEKKLGSDQVNEVFRIVHTIKGSSSMMEFDGMAKLSHAIEDMFSYIRENGATEQQWPGIFDLVFNAVSFFNGELAKLLNKTEPDGDATDLIQSLEDEFHALKNGAASAEKAADSSAAGKPSVPETGAENALSPDAPYYKIKVSFTDGCQMEDVRAFGVVQNLKKIHCRIATIPEDLNDASSTEMIRNSGLCIFIQTEENPDTIEKAIDGTLFLKSRSVLPIEGDDEEIPESIRKSSGEDTKKVSKAASKHAEHAGELESIAKQNFINVNVNKMDSLLNIVGEIVTAQSMVINNADFGDLPHDAFDASAQQLRSLIDELQDIVMNIRMMPVSTLFQKMRRLVRDMGKKFSKEIDLELIGEETEVDKNVIDSLSDPLLHIIRNSVDHGIEDTETRIAKGKPPHGKITLEAKMTGSYVIVTVSDDGKGLQRDAILKKAFEKGLIGSIDEDIPDKDVYALVFLPGFSTKEKVSEYSGRGVGMDVVRKNISKIGGSVTLESEPGKGTTVVMCIPLTLTIVDGMKFNVGSMNFIVPTGPVRSAKKPDPKDVFTDPDGNEMIMLLGKCYSLVRLKEYFNVEDGVTDISDGMIMHIATEQKEFCIFFDHLDGKRQVVVKTLPNYLKQCSTRLDGIGGCAILGDGSINLILDVNCL